MDDRELRRTLALTTSLPPPTKKEKQAIADYIRRAEREEREIREREAREAERQLLSRAMIDTTERAQLLKVSRLCEAFKNPCQLCHRRAAIGSKLHFKANAALFFVRKESHLEGDFCAVCIHKIFAGYMATNLLIGWWAWCRFSWYPDLFCGTAENISTH